MNTNRAKGRPARKTDGSAKLPSLPTKVKAAGWLWLAAAALELSMAGMMLSLRSERPLNLATVHLIIAIVLLYMGRQWIKARLDNKPPMSCYLTAALGVSRAFVGVRGLITIGPSIMVLIILTNGLLLLAGAGLALAGRKAYAAHRSQLGLADDDLEDRRA